MVTISYVKDFVEFYAAHKNFIIDKYKEACDHCDTCRDINLDSQLFQHMIDTGTLCVFELYVEEEFVGYSSVTLAPALLHKGKIDAYIDHLALDKNSRGKGVARDVIGQIEDFLLESFVDEVKLSLPHTEMHNEIADKLGYKKALVTHIKRLV